MTTVYSSKSNAMRAAKKLNVTFTVDAVEDGWAITTYTDTFTNELEVFPAGEVSSMAAEARTYTADELAAMGVNGAGTGSEELDDTSSAVCPHCGVNHRDNGYTVDGDEVNGVRLALTSGSFVCLGCNGEWGPIPATFAVKFEAFKAVGNSKCRSLRLVALEYNGNRKNFIADAMACGVKETTAGANWACMKRGEI